MIPVSLWIFLYVCIFMSRSARCHEIISLVDDFKENPDLGNELSLIVIGKTFTQADRNENWVYGGETNTRQKIVKNPMEELKMYSNSEINEKIPESKRGVIFATKLDKKKEISVFHDLKWKRYGILSQSVSFFKNRMLIAGGKTLEEFDLDKGTYRLFKSEWFQKIHTVEYNHDGTKCLLTSTGFDMIIEYDLEKGEIVWEWCTWEHGYKMSPFGFPVTRDLATSKEYDSNSVGHIFVDPKNPLFLLQGLAVPLRPSHLNGAFYQEDGDTIAVSFNHQGLLLFVSKSTNKSRVAKRQVDHPHAFRRQEREYPCQGYTVAETRTGSLLFLKKSKKESKNNIKDEDDDELLEICLEVSLKGMKGFVHAKAANNELEESFLEENKKEWTQYITNLGGDLYAVPDSKRGQIVLIEMVKKDYRVITNDYEMSIQEVILEPEHLTQKIIFAFEEEKRRRIEKKLREKEEYRSLLLSSTTTTTTSEIDVCYEDDDDVLITTEEKEEEKDIMKRLYLKKKEEDFNLNNILKRLYLKKKEEDFVKDFCCGNYGPNLEGFMTRDEVYCMMEEHTLCDGTIFWDESEVDEENDRNNPQIQHFKRTGFRPILKLIQRHEVPGLSYGEKVALISFENDGTSRILAKMEVESLFYIERSYMSVHMYGKSIRPLSFFSGDMYFNHNGVKSIMAMTGILVGGKITSCNLTERDKILHTPSNEVQNETSSVFEIEVVRDIITSKNDKDDVVYNDDIPEYLSYGQYDQKRITESELRERVDPRIKQNCKFCEYPVYDLNFHHGSGFLARSDAFTGGYGEYIYLITDLPTLEDRIEAMIEGHILYTNKIDYQNSVLEVYPISSSSSKEETVDPILIEVENVHIAIHDTIYRKKSYLVIRFPMKEELLETCFYILLKHNQTGFNYLTKPMLVRHCHERKPDDDDNDDKSIISKEKRDRLAICTMMYNKGRWMLEWIEWHRMMGVSHFYIYMHQATSLFPEKKPSELYYDSTFSLLDEYVKEGIVSIFLWNHTRDVTHWGTDQDAAGIDCRHRFRDRTEFFLFIDEDEFILPAQKKNILIALNSLIEEEKEDDINLSFLNGYSVKKVDFAPFRTNTSHLTTKIYRWTTPKFRRPKIILRSDSEVYAPQKHEILDEGLAVKKLSLLGDNTMIIIHYPERKFHEYNRIREPVEDEEYSDMYKRIQVFTNELEKRVEEMEEKVNFKQYGFEYNEFYESGDIDDYNNEKNNNVLTMEEYGVGIAWYDKWYREGGYENPIHEQDAQERAHIKKTKGKRPLARVSQSIGPIGNNNNNNNINGRMNGMDFRKKKGPKGPKGDNNNNNNNNNNGMNLRKKRRKKGRRKGRF